MKLVKLIVGSFIIFSSSAFALGEFRLIPMSLEELSGYQLKPGEISLDLEKKDIGINISNNRKSFSYLEELPPIQDEAIAISKNTVEKLPFVKNLGANSISIGAGVVLIHGKKYRNIEPIVCDLNSFGRNGVESSINQFNRWYSLYLIPSLNELGFDCVVSLSKTGPSSLEFSSKWKRIATFFVESNQASGFSIRPFISRDLKTYYPYIAIDPMNSNAHETWDGTLGTCHSKTLISGTPYIPYNASKISFLADTMSSTMEICIYSDNLCKYPITCSFSRVPILRASINLDSQKTIYFKSAAFSGSGPLSLRFWFYDFDQEILDSDDVL